MNAKIKIGRWSLLLSVCLAAILMVTGTGCEEEGLATDLYGGSGYYSDGYPSVHELVETHLGQFIEYERRK